MKKMIKIIALSSVLLTLPAQAKQQVSAIAVADAIADCQQEFAQVMEKAALVKDVSSKEEKNGAIVTRVIRLTSGTNGGPFSGPSKAIGTLTMRLEIFNPGFACDSLKCKRYTCDVDMK